MIDPLLVRDQVQGEKNQSAGVALSLNGLPGRLSTGKFTLNELAFGSQAFREPFRRDDCSCVYGTSNLTGSTIVIASALALAMNGVMHESAIEAERKRSYLNCCVDDLPKGIGKGCRNRREEMRFFV